VSEALSFTLLIGIVVLSVSVILLVGVSQLTEKQTTTEVEHAEQALVQFDSEASRVSSGSASTQETDLGLRNQQGTLDAQNNSGHITVTEADYDNGNTTEILNQSLGAVTYTNKEATVAYQGGGVWRKRGNSSVMLSPPEITMQGETLTMAVIRTTRGGSVYSDVQLSREDSQERFPNATGGLENQVQRSKVAITIQSQYYTAWGRFFEKETNAIVQYTHHNKQVTVTLFALPTNFAPQAGVIATTDAGELRLEGNGAYIDSYNSSQASYSISRTEQGAVKSGGDISLTGNSEIAGDAYSDAAIAVGGNAQIDGDASANGEINNGGGNNGGGNNGGGNNGGGNNGGGGAGITGNATENGSSVVSQAPITALVTDKSATLRTRNDNNATPVIVDNQLEVTPQNDTLTAGSYYVEQIDLQGESLTLNTTTGDIAIAVETWVRLRDNSQITVEGDGHVRLFVASNQETSVNGLTGWGQAPPEVRDGLHFVVKKNASVDVPGEASHQFIVLGPAEFKGAVAGSQGKTPEVTATIVAPAGGGGSGQFYAMHGHLYGAVVTGDITLGQSGEVHFDRSLQSREIPVGSNVSRLTYLYLMEHEITVESS
jgi:hypothetical protein